MKRLSQRYTEQATANQARRPLEEESPLNKRVVAVRDNCKVSNKDT